MKKSITLLILVIFLASVTSTCGPEISPVEPLPSATTQSKTTTAPPLPTETPGVASIAAWPPTPTPPSPGKTIVVNSTADSGPDSLRQAMRDAQRGDVITFNPAIFPPNSPTIIILESGLPEVTQGNLTIDASNAGVILDGSQVTGHGLSISSNSNTIRGLQITGFSDAGIALFGGAKFNIIGGDRKIGAGQLGQSNLLSGNGNFGIGLWNSGTSYNVIQGNLIGIRLDGTTAWGHARDGIHSNGADNNLITGNVIGGNDSGVYLCCVANGRNIVTNNNIIGTNARGENHLGNNFAGIILDRTGFNVIGPDNIIANNTGQGISLWEETPFNTITRNSIYNNGEQGISLNGPSRLAAPTIFDFDSQTGSLAGVTCANCIVEIFSDSADEGAFYEGRTISDSNGGFTFNKGIAFSGPHLTATATDSNGNTSTFSLSTTGARQSNILQEESAFPRTLLLSGSSRELDNTRIGDTWAGVTVEILPDPAQLSKHSSWLGHTWICLTFGEREWSGVEATGRFSPLYFSDYDDQVIDHLNEQGIAIMYSLTYFDSNLIVGPNFLRFRTEEEIQDYLDYARMVATHFRGRIKYYETWNEPNNNSGQQGIAVDDYIHVIRRLVPVIHAADPQAKVVIGGGSNLSDPLVQDYLMAILESDLMPIVDGIAIHPMYGSSPDYDELRQYYYDYPALIQRIFDTASAHGFTGEYFSQEMTWRSSLFTTADEIWTYTEIVAAKYYARGIVINRGLGLYAGIGGECYDCYPRVVRVVQNLNTVLAGAQPNGGHSIQIESVGADITRNHWFSLSNGDYLVAIWTDDVAIDDDPGISSTVIIPGFSDWNATDIDILNGFEQKLITSNENGDLVIRDLLIKDYPIIIRLAK